jgi:SAM-dependent methyltransferase
VVTQGLSDRAAHRAWRVGLTEKVNQGLVADLGCGRGEDLGMLAARHGGAGVRLVGVDASADAVASALLALQGEPRVSVTCASLSGRLPFDDGSVDLLYSHNLLECLPDTGTFAREVARVLRPGGQGVIGHWDWDSQLFDAGDKPLVRRLVHAYADWQQDWMEHADGWLGRRLRVLRGGLELGECLGGLPPGERSSGDSPSHPMSRTSRSCSRRGC